ncbi:SDR family NAD(P)-dependent oxidoreductase [Bacillota bacterium HCP3S3_E9]
MKVLVIGADQGLGKVLVRKLKENGYTTVAGLFSMKNKPEQEEGVLYLPMDVTNEEQLQTSAERMEETVGKINCVVSVAGILPPEDRTCTLMTEPIEVIRKQLDVNAVGVVTAFRTMMPHMEKGSKFFAVTSEGGSFTLAGTLFPGYGVSKTAANKFVQVLRLTCGTDPVDLIAVHPGRMNTEMGRTTAQIEPEESANGFLNLISGKTEIHSEEHWFIDYLGHPMPV